MSLHRSCCPCDGCYCGTLCAPCVTNCVDVAQPAATACISKREWEANIDSVTNGTGAGWMIWVDGAYYFFDGTLSTCDVDRGTVIDWLISFKADACIDLSDITVTVPFSGGWGFDVPFTITSSANDAVVDVLDCAISLLANPGITSASEPTFDTHAVELVSAAATALALVYDYNDPDTSTANVGSMTSCTGTSLWAYSGAGNCSNGGFTFPVSVSGIGFGYVASGGSALDAVCADTIRFDYACTTGSYLLEIVDNSNVDGYFEFNIGGTCLIKFIGPVAQFVNLFNAITAGSGLSATALDGSWFLGCKVRSAYVGTVDQPTFPYSSSAFGFAASTTLSAGGTTTADMTTCDEQYPPLTGTASFFGKSSITQNPGSPFDTCPDCPFGANGLGGARTVNGSHSSALDVDGNVREIYGISLHPASWTWTEDGTTTDCTPTGVTWTVA